MTLRLIRIRTDHAKVQMTNRALSMLTSNVAEVDALFYNDTQPRGVPILLFTGAKAYCRGGGWWDIMGYASDGTDVQRVIDKLSTL